jgi:methylated-DNA-[protein]-cysteine S-methyltransferase
MKEVVHMNLVSRRLASPVGNLTLFANDDGLVAVTFPERHNHTRGTAELEASMVRRHPVLDLAAAELAEYFAGKRKVFRTPLRPAGTEFQQAVWMALRAIPFGASRSYADIAQAIGRPKAVRAVGLANGSNPLAILVPCHRVIGRDGSLTGYGGGLPAKRWLLEHEGIALAGGGGFD